MSEKVLIIGAGHAGGILATQLARGKGRYDITVIGEETHPPYERPPLSKQLLAGEVPVEKTHLRPEKFYQDRDITLKLSSRVKAIYRTEKAVELEDGTTMSYDKLALCTGTRVREIPVPGADMPGVHYIRTIDDTLGIQKALKPESDVVVIGGGYIGLEAAAVLVKQGHRVKVIEMLDRVLARSVAEPVSRFYEKCHREAGVEILLNTGTDRFEGDGRIERVIDGDGNAHAADAVIVGIGVVPNVELAMECGLECNDGILVDEFARTDDPDIFAAGDCTNHPNALLDRHLRLESVQNAVDQARCIANVLLDKPAPYAEVPWFWSDQYDLKLQMAGIPGPDDQVVIRGDMDSRSFSVFYLKLGRVTAVNAINSGSDYVRGRKWIAEGVTVVPSRLADTDILIKEV